MGNHFLQYTSWKSIKNGGRPTVGPFFYASSKQYDRIGLCKGDVIWHISLRPNADGQPPELTLCGRLVVETIMRSEAEAAAIIKRRIDQVYLWGQQSIHAFAGEDAEPYDEVDISDLAAQLRFESPTGADRLDIVDGAINAQQFQAIRRLTPWSVRLLAQRWEHRLIS